MEEKIETYNKNRAKELIDLMFDTKIFKDSVTRDDMNGFEDLIAFHFQCYANTAKKNAEFALKWKNK